MLEQMLLLSVASLRFWGFLSLDFLQEETFARPAQPLPNHPECVGAPHKGRAAPQGSHGSTTSPNLMW